jgi:hypothetical protein
VVALVALVALVEVGVVVPPPPTATTLARSPSDGT